MPAEGSGDCKIFFEQWEASVKNFHLFAILHVRMSFGVQITNARYVLESLGAHRAGVHAQSTAYGTRNSFHPFESTEICRACSIGYLPQFYPCACGDFAAVDLGFFEIAAVRMNDNPANAAVADKKIRSASDNEQLQMFIAAKTNEFREGLFGARLGPELRRTANAQRRVVRQRLVKANLALFAHNRFQFLSDHKIGCDDL